ncbi:MAG TPA: hypothetical protein PLR99_05855 [Polyangiaceae bacterium]|nr:hypothetical protein [Polyangiaceae bacterium]
MKKVAFSLSALVLVASGLVACSSDSTTPADAGPTGSPGTVNTAAAKSSSTTLVGGVSKAVDGNDGNASLALLIQGAQQSQSVVTPSAGGASATPSSVTLRDVIGQVSQAITSCDGACTGTSCDFKGCGTETPQSSVTISGVLSWTGGNLKCTGLTYDISTATTGGTKTKITLDCDVTASASSLKGFVKSTGSTTLNLGDAGAPGGVGSVAWTSDTTFNDVKYTAGKPTSGSVKVSATTTVAGQTYTGSADITYP